MEMNLDPMGQEVSVKEPMTDNSGVALLQGKPRIGEEEVRKAGQILAEYQRGKANLETRIVENEQWYQLRHWDTMRSEKDPNAPQPASAWLFNAIMNKHADAMDNYPLPNVLPREQQDEKDAKTLSEILPVIIERNGFDSTYSNNWWEKLKHGTAPYGVFWDKDLENGLGDISIKQIDLLNIFWEPGITDIQRSQYLFIVDLVDNEILAQTYPQFEESKGGQIIELKQYEFDQSIDNSEKSLVVDCYYRVKTPSGRINLHLLKFCGETLLFASENEEEYAEEGFYAHGKYPVVFDTLFPEKGTPVGFGYVSICKDPQMYIDKLSQNIMKSSMMATTPRYFVASSSGVNEEEFSDWSKDIIHVEGSLDDLHLRQLQVNNISGVYLNVLQMKIDEMKETAANRDVNSGGAGSGVTAAAAIAALQEAGNKNSRDMISAAYRAYTEMMYLCIELIRQFYDETRTFRITGESGEYQFVDYNNENIKDQELPPIHPDSNIPTYRRPVFDIRVCPEKKNPFSQMAQNETAKELYQMGIFNPERATEAQAMLEMMEFDGIDKIRAKVAEGQTLLNMCQKMSQQLEQMGALLAQSMGQQPQDIPATESEPFEHPHAPSGSSVSKKAVDAQKTQMTPYGERLAERAKPSMEQMGL